MKSQQTYQIWWGQFEQICNLRAYMAIFCVFKIQLCHLLRSASNYFVGLQNPSFNYFCLSLMNKLVSQKAFEKRLFQKPCLPRYLRHPLLVNYFGAAQPSLSTPAVILLCGLIVNNPHVYLFWCLFGKYNPGHRLDCWVFALVERESTRFSTAINSTEPFLLCETHLHHIA